MSVYVGLFKKPFHVVCQSTSALPSARPLQRTNMEKHHPVSDLHSKVYGKKNINAEWRK